MNCINQVRNSWKIYFFSNLVINLKHPLKRAINSHKAAHHEGCEINKLSGTMQNVLRRKHLIRSCQQVNE